MIYNVFGDLPMFTVKEKVKNELVINKSKFITLVYKVNSKKEVTSILNEIKNTYKDATHYCFAYVIGENKRFSDNGEPSHTAGMPILNVLESKKLTNVLVVVVRYFGGIKLGAGGLTRAYSNSVSLAIKDDNIIPFKKTSKIKIEFKYDVINDVNYILKDFNITYKEFDDNIIYEFEYEEDNYPNNLDAYLIKKTDV